MHDVPAQARQYCTVTVQHCDNCKTTSAVSFQFAGFCEVLKQIGLLLGSRPESLHSAAVPPMDTTAERAQEPRISGACRTISRLWSKILNAKERMITPRKLIKKLPTPYNPASCIPVSPVLMQEKPLLFSQLYPCKQQEQGLRMLLGRLLCSAGLQRWQFLCYLFADDHAAFRSRPSEYRSYLLGYGLGLTVWQVAVQCRLLAVVTLSRVDHHAFHQRRAGRITLGR